MKGNLGIIGCPMLEDEIVHVIGRDSEIDEVYVVRNEECDGVVEKLSKAGLAFSLIEASAIGSLPRDGYGVVVLMKSLGLHQEPEELRDDIMRTAHSLDGEFDSIVLFYGLCGNAFKDLDLLTDDMTTPVFILRDRQGRIVDDCIAAPLGGTDGYLALLKRYPGVMYHTPAFAIKWEEMLYKMEMLRGVEDIEDPFAFSKMLFEMAGYEKVLIIRTGLGDEELADAKTKEFAELYDFRIEELEPGWCSLHVTEDAWESARTPLNGASASRPMGEAGREA